MLSRILALLNRSLRVDVRSRSSHLTRFAMMVCIYLAIIQVLFTWGALGAPGLAFFKSILWLDLVFATLMGVGGFSSTITEEKEEDTLGLLRMAGVDSIGLLLGKVGGRLLQALALLVVQYPFTLLSITMGGTGHAQVMSAYVALAAYLVMLAGVGVLVSTICQTSRGAAQMMVAFLVLYCVIPSLCYEWLSWLFTSGQTSVFTLVLRGLSESCIFRQVGDIISTGYLAPLLNSQVLTNGGLGIVSLLVAWALFDVCTRNPRSEPISRGPVSYKGRMFRWFRPGRAFDNALMWKDYQFGVGGVTGLLIRFACYVALFVFIFLINPDDATEIFVTCLIGLIPFDASLLISRSMQDEVRGQTIPSLVMLPKSVPQIVYSKIGGALLGLIPGLTCWVIAFLFSGLMEELLQAMSSGQASLAFLFVIPYVALLPHLTAVIGLVTRWGATPLALGSLYAIQMVETMIFFPIILATQSIELMLVLTGLLNVGICVACHFEVMRRFRKLAEK